MDYKPLSIQELRDAINRGEVCDPLVFLESIMNGQDPRQLSDIYKLVTDIDEFGDGELSRSDWNDVVDLVVSRFKYHTVSLSESIAATKTLAEYLHAKRKQIDINTGELTSPHNTPLTSEEVELFKEKFNDEF